MSQTYISITEYAQREQLSRRRVQTLIEQNRIPGAQLVGSTWIIPADAQRIVGRKPKSTEVKS